MKRYACINIIKDFPQHNYRWVEDSNNFLAQEKINRISIPRSVLKSTSADNLFKTLHEIGHCQTFETKQNKVTREFLATQWAIFFSQKYNVKLCQSSKKQWQEYIYSFTKAKNKSKYQLDWSPMERSAL